MPTRYLDILAVQSPFPFMVDANNRTHVSCNFTATRVASANDFENEIGALIVNAGLAVQGSTLFKGRNAKIPTGDGPYVVVAASGGDAPLETHNGSKYERRRFQIVVVGLVYSTAKAKADAIWTALDGVRNETVTGLS